MYLQMFKDAKQPNENSVSANIVFKISLVANNMECVRTIMTFNDEHRYAPRIILEASNSISLIWKVPI